VLVVGQGSNLLIGDAGVRGVVVVLDGAFATWSAEGDRGTADGGEVTAGGAMKLPILARQSVRDGWTGLEWMVGVPGSIGGAVRMNAGGHGSDVAASLISATVFDVRRGLLESRLVPAFEFSYRSSNLAAHDVVVSARFRVGRRDAAVGEAELSEIVRWRREHQPGGANCGSVFTNPPGDSAGRLIDAAGLKNLRIGTAAVSEKHANFIQADEGASAADVWALIVEVRRCVHERFGVELHPEVRTIGFDATLPNLGPSLPERAPTSSTATSHRSKDFS
jgi:UDP-N-acetylmuramate dehydrogenase